MVTPYFSPLMAGGVVAPKPRRVHLSVKNRQVACGLATEKVFAASRRPHEVTCMACRRSLSMVDAEVLAKSRPRGDR